MTTLADRLRESSHDRWFTDSALLQEAADELDRLTALEAEHKPRHSGHSRKAGRVAPQATTTRVAEPPTTPSKPRNRLT